MEWCCWMQGHNGDGVGGRGDGMVVVLGDMGTECFFFFDLLG